MDMAVEHVNSRQLFKTCIRSSQLRDSSMEEGVVPEALAGDGCWGRESHFSLSYIIGRLPLAQQMTLHLRVYAQHYLTRCKKERCVLGFKKRA